MPLQSIVDPIGGKAKGERVVDVSDCLCFGRLDSEGF